MLNQSKNIFIVGIKGAAMANLAVILQKMGKQVFGSDVKEEFITDPLLKKNGINISIGFESKLITKDIDLVVYSAAHGGEKNPQVIAAKKMSIKTLHQANLLGELLKQFKTSIAVCGCHGKTTTSSLLSYALIKLMANPSYMIGSSNFNQYPGGDYNGKDFFVIEADEYGVNPPHDLTPKFHFLDPDYILCTNIDFDHPDIYKNIEQIQGAYLKFFNKKRLFLCADDPYIIQSIKQLDKNQYLTYGFAESSNLKILSPVYKNYGSEFELKWKKKSLGVFSISLFGEKNVSNATGVILTLLQMGFQPSGIKEAIKDFTGAKRRFELIYKKNNTFLFDDYAHHPKEIETTVRAAKKRFPKRRIVVIFQPHTFSRTQLLLKDFAKSLNLANKCFVMPIFPSARENSKLFTVTSKDFEQFPANKLKAVSNKKELLWLLTSDLKPQDIVFTMGAGDIYKLADDIIKIIKSL